MKLFTFPPERVIVAVREDVLSALADEGKFVDVEPYPVT